MWDGAHPPNIFLISLKIIKSLKISSIRFGGCFFIYEEIAFVEKYSILIHMKFIYILHNTLQEVKNVANILFLEDDRNIREVTCEYLLLESHKVYEAKEGTEALEILKEAPIEIAILDILVPEPNGLEVLAHIQREYTNVACIMLSALEDERTQLEAFENFADDYIIKPFSPKLLLKRIEVILRRNASARQEENGFVLDEKQYQAYLDGQSLHLTLTEFILLEVLIQYPKQVFTRGQLLEHIAPNDFMVSDRVVDAHIKNLRKKCPKDTIRTVIGVGYALGEGEHL
jgi:Response regulators consisting of a CheY-like receiver domain and a winged-helix DNA-binding domain